MPMSRMRSHRRQHQIHAPKHLVQPPIIDLPHPDATRTRRPHPPNPQPRLRRILQPHRPPDEPHTPAPTNRPTAARATPTGSASHPANPRSADQTASTPRPTPATASPDNTPQHAAASPASRAKNPGAASPVRSGLANRPFPTFIPNTPHQAAGIRTDPAPSLPVARGTTPEATATADPADDPPGVRSYRQGLTVRPCRPTPQVRQGVPAPGTAVRPTGTHPASKRAPHSDRPPLTAIGTPANGNHSPSRTRASTARAQTPA